MSDLITTAQDTFRDACIETFVDAAVAPARASPSASRRGPRPDRRRVHGRPAARLRDHRRRRRHPASAATIKDAIKGSIVDTTGRQRHRTVRRQGLPSPADGTPAVPAGPAGQTGGSYACVGPSAHAPIGSRDPGGGRAARRSVGRVRERRDPASGLRAALRARRARPDGRRVHRRAARRRGDHRRASLRPIAGQAISDKLSEIVRDISGDG